MSDYTVTTDFSVKDSLVSGDPDKKIIGSEWDTEFDGISAAIATKQDFSPRGALAYTTTNQTITTATETAITFNAEKYDTDSIHDNSTNTSRLTVPSGVTKVMLQAQVYWQTPGTTGYRRAAIYKNGAAFNTYGSYYVDFATNASYSECIETPVYSVTAGDYFELYVEHTEGSDENIYSNSGQGTWFAMEIIE